MATNIKYLKENNLYEAHKHFMSLVEGYIPEAEAELEEAGEDMQDPNAMGGDPNAMGGADPMAGGDPNAMGGGMPQDPNGGMGGDPNAMGGDPNAMGGADPMAGGDPNAMGEADPMASGDPNAMGADPMAEAPMGEEESADEDGDTIDIDGLTKAQDKLNVKQNHIGRDLAKVDARMNSLIDTIKNLLSKVEDNNNEIEALKAEFEKRNPTQTEKLNLRSLDSYPFNVKPNDFWAEKAKQGGYEAYSDNAEPTTKEYVITNDDVDNPDDDIANTFFKVEDDDIQTLEKLFKL